MDETKSNPSPSDEHPNVGPEPPSPLEEEVQAAKDELSQAKLRLREAEQKYREARERLREDEEQGELPYGDVLQRALAFVKKHPGVGVGAAAAIGFVLGRLMRR